jgi:predicted Na+-dependent transporter
MPFKGKDLAGAFNQALERFMPVLTPCALVLGVLFPSFFLVFKPFVPLIFGVMTLSGALKLTVRDLARAISRPKAIVFFLLSCRVVTPLGVCLLSRHVFGLDADTVSGYVLIYAVPTAVTSFMWVSIFRGNAALTLAFILLDTLLAPLAVPGTVRLLLGTGIVLDMSGMAVSLMYMVVIPTVLGVALNELSRGAAPRIAGPWLTPLAKLCMMLVISANTASVADQIDPRNFRFWITGLVCVIFSVMGFLAGQFAGFLGRFEKDTRISLFFGVGLHNISASMTLGIAFFPPAAALPSVLGVIFQQTISALMGRLIYRKA